MKVNSSARCCYCGESMGRPVKVTEYEGKNHTLYECYSCNREWLRPHN